MKDGDVSRGDVGRAEGPCGPPRGSSEGPPEGPSVSSSVSFSFCELKAHHLGQMAHNLRLSHVRVAMGRDIRQNLKVYYEQSSFRKAWKINGKLAAVGGVTGSLLASEGFVWLAFTEEALRFPKAIVREARRQLEEILLTKVRLTTFIPLDDGVGRRFAEFLGFDFVGVTEDDFLMLEKTREKKTKKPPKRGGALRGAWRGGGDRCF